MTSGCSFIAQGSQNIRLLQRHQFFSRFQSGRDEVNIANEGPGIVFFILQDLKEGL